jgi:hypothetical protein
MIFASVTSPPKLLVVSAKLLTEEILNYSLHNLIKPQYRFTGLCMDACFNVQYHYVHSLNLPIMYL